MSSFQPITPETTPILRELKNAFGVAFNSETRVVWLGVLRTVTETHFIVESGNYNDPLFSPANLFIPIS